MPTAIPGKLKQVILGLGSNLEGPGGREPRENLEAALVALTDVGCRLVAQSSWYESAPVPASDQPWFVNGAALIETDLPPGKLLAVLHSLEADFGRVRRRRLEARVLDLDILDYRGQVLPDAVRWAAAEGAADEKGELFLPHLRMHQRLFVLRPLADIAPEWQHPVLGKGVGELQDALANAGKVRKLR